MPLPRRRACALLLAVSLLGGCGSDPDDWSEPRAKPVAAVGSLGAGFVDPENPPPPEGTVEPRPGSWNAVRPPKGYRVVLLSAGTDAPTRTVVDAVKAWADEVDASLKTLTAERPAQYVPRISEAIELRPDLVVTAGNDLVDALALVTANHLSQQFLVVGAQLAEPTENVTAADWPGGGFRGEGLGLPEAYDPASFTPDRAGRAVRAGVAAVLHGIRGVVIRIDGAAAGRPGDPSQG